MSDAKRDENKKTTVIIVDESDNISRLKVDSITDRLLVSVVPCSSGESVDNAKIDENGNETAIVVDESGNAKPLLVDSNNRLICNLTLE